jgi:hypothetical protein
MCDCGIVEVVIDRTTYAVDIITPKKKRVIQALLARRQISSFLVPVFGDSARGALAGQISFYCASEVALKEDRTDGHDLLLATVVVAATMVGFVLLKEQGEDPVW